MMHLQMQMQTGRECANNPKHNYRGSVLGVSSEMVVNGGEER
jgi:hypothetical protein